MRVMGSGWGTRLIVALGCAGAVACSDKTATAPSSARYIVGAEGNFRSIAVALNAAPPGDAEDAIRAARGHDRYNGHARSQI